MLASSIQELFFKELKEVLVVFKTLYQILYQVIGFADSRVLGFFGSRGFSGSQVLGSSGPRVRMFSGSHVRFLGYWALRFSETLLHF